MLHRTGTALKSLATFPGYYYDPSTNLPTNLLERVVVLTGGTHIVDGIGFPTQVLVNFNTGADGLRTVIRMDSASDGTDLASGVSWATDQGQVTTGLAGENLSVFFLGLPYFYDPDSVADSDGIGSTIAVSGGTGFSSATYGVSERYPSYGSGPSTLFELTDIGSGSLPPTASYSGSWTLTHPSFKLSDAQALVPPVTSYAGALKLMLVGDSVTANLATRSRFAGYLASTFPNATSITLDNMGVGGSKTADWVPGQTNYNNAVTQANISGTKVINLCLGINDVNTGVSASTILANLRLIIDGLFADIPTLKKILVQDIPSPNGSSTTTANTAISAVGHGATYTSAPFYTRLWANSVLATDTLHPSSAGRHYQSLTWLIPLSTEIPAAEGPTVPDAPVVTGFATSPTAIVMDIETGASDGGSPVVTFEVWRNLNGAGYFLFQTIDVTDTDIEFADTTTAVADDAAYKVRSVNAIGASPFSSPLETDSLGPELRFITPSVALYRAIHR